MCFINHSSPTWHGDFISVHVTCSYLVKHFKLTASALCAGVFISMNCTYIINDIIRKYNSYGGFQSYYIIFFMF